MILKKTLLATFTAMTIAGNAIADNNVNAFGTDPAISDMALIYAGESRRLTWTEEHFEPYLTHKFADGHEDWFFDAFLFLETSHGNVAFSNGMKDADWAKQEDYNWLLDQFFDEDLKLHALDRLISKKKTTLGEPPLRHKVVITAIAPVKMSNGNWSRAVWGKVDGQSVYLMSDAGRIKATSWLVDQIIERFNAANFQNLDLAGIYWVEEGLYTNGSIMASINDYIHSKGLKSYWIPYYPNNSQYWSQWSDTYNFDMCYIQPNYAFYNSNGTLPPYSQLTETCDAAKSYGMGLEFEFETQATSNAMHSVNPTLHQHINDYMDVFEQKGVFDQAGIAYYTGTKGLYDMAASEDPVDHATIDRLANYVVTRQKAAAASITEVTADTDWAHVDGDTVYISADAPKALCHDISGRLIHSGAGTFTCNSGLYILSAPGHNTLKFFVK